MLFGVLFCGKGAGKRSQALACWIAGRHMCAGNLALGYNSPNSRARATASVRRWTWSLLKIFRHLGVLDKRLACVWECMRPLMLFPNTRQVFLSPFEAHSMCGVTRLFRLVSEHHDPRRTRLGVDQLQIDLLLDVVEERLTLPQQDRMD